MLLVDTHDMTPEQRVEAFGAAMGQASVPCRIEHLVPAPDISARMNLWQLGTANLFTADSSGFRLVRIPRHVRRESPPMVALAVQARGQGRYSQFGHDQLVGGRELMLSDLTAPYSFSWAGTGASRAFQIPYDQLGLSVDVVRAAAPRLRSSPLHDLVHAHLRRLHRSAASISDDVAAFSVGTATIELVRALIASAATDDGVRRDVLGETLLSRVLADARLRVADPGLTPEALARAHHVSVRRLYSACAEAGISLEQWIIDQRLEAARAQLISPGAQHRSIAAVSRACGFQDASHFARHFRDAYGLTPSEWRQRSGRVA